MNRISTTRPNEIFKIISEFALEYRTTRERVLQQVKKMNHRERSRTRGFTTTQSHENNNDAVSFFYHYFKQNGMGGKKL